jgi:hypothetical protein
VWGYAVTTMRIYYLKALASALLLSGTVAFGAAIGTSENLQKRAQLEGISISFNRDNVDWKDLAAQGLSFTYVAATGGYGKRDACTLVSWNPTNASFQAIRTLISPRSLLGPQLPVSFVVLTTSPFFPSLLAHSRQITLSPTVETGLTTASPSRAASKSAVGVSTFQICNSRPLFI